MGRVAWFAVWFGVCCSGWVTSAHAQKTLTLEDLLTSVRHYFPLIVVAEQERNIANAEARTAVGAFDTTWITRGTATPVGYYDYATVDSLVEQPTALWGTSFYGGWRIGRGDIPDYEGKVATTQYGEVRGGVMVPIWRNGPIDKRRAGLARAELGQDTATLALEQQKIEALRVASIRYWDWVAAGQKIDIAKALLKIAVERDSQIASRVDKGDLAAIERTDNARAIAGRQSQLVAAERLLQQASFELSLYLRDKNGRPVTADPAQLPAEMVEPSITFDSVDKEVRHAIERRPDVRRLELQRRQNKIDLDLASNQTKPAVDVRMGVSRDMGPTDPTLTPTVVEGGMLLDIPVQNRVAKGRADASRAAMTRMAELKRYAEDRVQAEVRDAISAVTMARERLHMVRQEVELTLEMEKAEREKFQLGDSTLFVVYLREQSTADAELREVDAMLELHRAVANYRAATATLK
jgi:cobalt-zinc-cadmium efflux system outer membrane protein